MITNAKAYAHFAGLNYLIIFVLAIFANFFVLSGVIVAGDAAATAANIVENEGRFRLAFACLIVVLLADVFIAWALYLILQSVNQPLSLLAMLFRLAYTVAQIGVILNFSKVLQLASAGEIQNTAGVLENSYFTHFFASAHGVEFTMTLIFFGVHLVLLGYLITRASFLPSVIGVLVAIAGLGYMVDGFAEVLWDGYGPGAGLGLYIVVLPALIGEGGLCLWLLLRGLDQHKWTEAITSSR